MFLRTENIMSKLANLTQVGRVTNFERSFGENFPDSQNVLMESLFLVELTKLNSESRNKFQAATAFQMGLKFRLLVKQLYVEQFTVYMIQ